MNVKKMANNILEYMINPTVVPVEKRLYIGPAENLKNEVYENAKKDSEQAYGSQKHNSDMYPMRNRLKNMEVCIMDRKSMIASFDILAQHFTDKDPINVDLKAMAKVVASMNDEEFEQRILSEEVQIERSVEAKKKMKTFPCPKCGTKVLEQTGFCVKCKKKCKPEKKKASEEEIKEVETTQEKEAQEEVESLGSWSKGASEAVKKALYEEIHGVQAEEKEEEEEVKEEEVKEAGKIKGPGIPDGTGPSDKCPFKKDSEKESKKEKAATEEPKEEKPATEEPKEKEEEDKSASKEEKEVDTSVLKESFGDVELEESYLECTADSMSKDEVEKLSSLFK